MRLMCQTEHDHEEKSSIHVNHLLASNWMTIFGAIIKRISDWTPLHYNEAIIWPRRVARHTTWRVLRRFARMIVSYTHKSWQKSGSHRAQELNLILRVSAFSHDELRQSTAAMRRAAHRHSSARSECVCEWGRARALPVEPHWGFISDVTPGAY